MKKKGEENNNGKGKSIIFISIFLMLAFLGGCGYYLTSTGMLKLNINKSENEYINLGEFKVNLKDTDKKRYFNGTISIAYDKSISDNKKEFTKEKQLPVVQDVINSYLREKTYDYLANSDNTEQIKKDMMNEINKELQTCKITDIRFSQYLLQ